MLGIHRALVLLACAGVARAELLQGGLREEDGVFKVGGERVAPGPGVGALLAELARLGPQGSRVVLEGERPPVGLFHVDRVVSPIRVACRVTVLRDHTRKGRGEHFVLWDGFAYRPEPGPLTDLLPGLLDRRVEVRGWALRDEEGTALLGEEVPGRLRLTGIQARGVGGPVWIRGVEGDLARTESVEGGVQRPVPLQALELGERAGERARLRGTLVYDPLPGAFVLLSGGQPHALRYEAQRWPLPRLGMLEGLEVELEGLLSVNPGGGRELLVERAHSPVNVALAQGTLEPGRSGELFLLGERGTVRLLPGVSRRLDPQRDHVQARREEWERAERVRGSLFARLRAFPREAVVGVRGWGLLDAEGRLTHLFPTHLAALDATGRLWWAREVQPGVFIADADGPGLGPRRELTAADLGFDLRGTSGLAGALGTR